MESIRDSNIPPIGGEYNEKDLNSSVVGSICKDLGV